MNSPEANASELKRPSLGRRSRNVTSNDRLSSLEDASPFANIIGSSPPSLRSRRMATWADEGAETLNYLQGLHQNKSQKNKKSEPTKEDFDEVMPMIPDLEEVREQEFVQQTAQAPTVQVNKLVSLQELDKDLLKQAAFSSLDGIDLCELTKFCLPENQVREEDVSWNWDNLISEVTSKFQSNISIAPISDEK